MSLDELGDCQRALPIPEHLVSIIQQLEDDDVGDPLLESLSLPSRVGDESLKRLIKDIEESDKIIKRQERHIKMLEQMIEDMKKPGRPGTAPKQRQTTLADFYQAETTKINRKIEGIQEALEGKKIVRKEAV